MADREDTDAALTELVRRAGEGDRPALDGLVNALYEELRSAADIRRAQWRGDETVSATVLLHEVYVRLARQQGAGWQTREQFLAVASRAMRQILIDYSRRRRAEKRGGGLDRVTLDRVVEVLPTDRIDPLESTDVLTRLEEALSLLERDSERHARIVECRFFGGMTIEETAAAMNLSTVNRGWRTARAWLRREMSRSPTK